MQKIYKDLLDQTIKRWTNSAMTDVGVGTAVFEIPGQRSVSALQLGETPASRILRRGSL